MYSVRLSELYCAQHYLVSLDLARPDCLFPSPLCVQRILYLSKVGSEEDGTTTSSQPRT